MAGVGLLDDTSPCWTMSVQPHSKYTLAASISIHVYCLLFNTVASLTVCRYWSKFSHVLCDIIQCHISDYVTPVFALGRKNWLAKYCGDCYTILYLISSDLKVISTLDRNFLRQQRSERNVVTFGWKCSAHASPTRSLCFGTQWRQSRYLWSCSKFLMTGCHLSSKCTWLMKTVVSLNILSFIKSQ